MLNIKLCYIWFMIYAINMIIMYANDKKHTYEATIKESLLNK